MDCATIDIPPSAKPSISRPEHRWPSILHKESGISPPVGNAGCTIDTTLSRAMRSDARILAFSTSSNINCGYSHGGAKKGPVNILLFLVLPPLVGNGQNANILLFSAQFDNT